MEHIVRADGRDVRVLELGQGEPLYVPHGFANPPENGMNFYNALAEHNKVFVPVISGVNYLKKQPCTVEECTDLASAVAYELGILTPDLRIVGYSIGGDIAAMMAHNEGAGKLVLLCPDTTGDHGFLWYLTSLAFMTAKESVNSGNFEFSSASLPVFLDNMRKNPLASWNLLYDHSKFDYSALDVVTPTLLVAGTKDKYTLIDGLNELTEEELKRVFAEAFPNLEVAMIDMGHIGPFVKTKEVVDEISDFVN